MSKAQQRRFIQDADDHQKQIIRIIQDISRRHGIDRTWADLMEVSAIALARLDQAQFASREEQYLRVIRKYERDEQQLMAEAFAHLVMTFDRRITLNEDGTPDSIDFTDVLGSTYMMLDLGNAGTGQFFTPYSVSFMMASMSFNDAGDIVKQRGFVRVHEPACGAGGMIIAAAHALHDAKINYQQAMHATAIDIDIRCVHMAFVQLSLLHIPAVVVHGNALSMESWSHWVTPAHILGAWPTKLHQRRAIDQMQELLQGKDAGEEPSPEPSIVASASVHVPARIIGSASATGQMQLF